MRWTEIEILGPGPTAEALANILLEAGSQGVEIRPTSPSISATDPGEHRVLGYFPGESDAKALLKAVEARLARVHQAFPGSRCRVHTRAVNEEDWAHQWRRFFSVQKPVPGLVIKPTWEQYGAEPGETVIELDPGLAFGTGTHATTVLCLQELRQLIFGGETVIDVGTGSGILAIAAAKLGAERVWALDSDPTALRVATENLEINRMENHVKLQGGDLLQGFEGKAQLIVGNISTEAAEKLLAQFEPVLVPGGHLVLSGVLERHQGRLEKLASERGLRTVRARSSPPWVALVLERPPRNGS